MLKQLTDLEFSILWYMPNLDIMVTKETQKYIEDRRRRLGLKFKPDAGFNLNNEPEQ